MSWSVFGLSEYCLGTTILPPHSFFESVLSQRCLVPPRKSVHSLNKIYSSSAYYASRVFISTTVIPLLLIPTITLLYREGAGYLSILDSPPLALFLYLVISPLPGSFVSVKKPSKCTGCIPLAWVSSFAMTAVCMNQGELESS